MATVAVGLIMGIAAAAQAGSSAYAASQTPDSPDYAAASRAGILADIETLPLRKLIERAARMGERVTYTDPETGKEKTYDFTGKGDIDISRGEMEFQRESADTMAQTVLGIQEKFGEKFVAARLKELEQSDPIGFALRKQLGEQATSELGLGYKLAPGMREEVVQAERTGQAARGNIMGASAGASEAMQVGNAAYRLYQQRLANAASFLSGQTPVAQFQQISGAQQGAAPVAGMPIQQGIGQNPNAGAMGYQAEQWGYQQNIQNNPWLSLAGDVGGMGLGVAGLGAGGMALGELYKQYPQLGRK